MYLLQFRCTYRFLLPEREALAVVKFTFWTTAQSHGCADVAGIGLLRYRCLAADARLADEGA